MGKKHIVEKSQEEIIKEKEEIDQTLKKQAGVRLSGKISLGRIYISSSYNNTIVTLTDNRGQVLATKSAGSVGFKGTKKATSFAASRVAEAIVAICKKIGLEKIEVFIKGVGVGRESALRTLVNQGLNVISIKDVTPIPHNGGRPKKVRRV